MVIDTAEDLWTLIKKSRLLSAEQLDEARQAIERCEDPKAVAKALIQRDLLTRWQAGQLLAGRSSFFLGKYKLIEPIGRGGMGSVFLGQHTTMNRRVALKILSRHVGKDPASLERFLDEARAVAALDHPNIVQAYTVDHDADRYYLVMEHIEGRDLKQLVEAEGLPDFEMAADYVRQAADGLQHGHARNMIHCDIKPSNLLVNTQGVLKIVDMGLARLDQRDRDEHTNGQGQQMLGTVDYLAPEQGLESSDFDHRADIYSLGCTLYFLLTGHPPFPEGTLSERIVKHQMQQPRSIRQQRQDAPTGLVRICEKMMAKKAEDRFQSAEEVGRVLGEWQLREPEPKRPEPKPIVPLKTAQPLDEPAGRRLPQINVDAESPSAAVGRDRDPSQKSGVLQTRRRKIAAVLAAGLVAAGLATAVAAIWIGSAQGPDRQDPRRPQATTTGPENNEPAATQSTSPDKPGTNRRVPPVNKPPVEKPPVEKPAADKPNPKKPPADKPEPEKPGKEPRKPRKKPDRPKKTDPFLQFAATIDLPVLRSGSGSDAQPGDLVSLGKLDLGTDAVCDIEIEGGDNVVPGNRRLALERKPGGKEWLIHVNSDAVQGVDADRTDLARIWIDRQTLNFRWLQQAARARGNYLRSCALVVRVDEQSRWLPLSRPKNVEPLVLDLDAGLARTVLPMADGMPKVGMLKLQVTGLEGPFPEHVLTPIEGISEDGPVEIHLAEENLPGIVLRVKLVRRGRAANVEVTAAYLLPDQIERPLRSKEALRVSQEFFAVQSRWENTRKKLNKQDPRRPDIKRQIDRIKDSLEQLTALGGLYRRLHQVGKIHFRVFRAVGDRQIELFSTKRTVPDDSDQNERPDEPE